MANLPFVLPAHALHLLAQCRSECGSAPWLELRMSGDHALLRDRLTRAQQAGCEVLVLSAAPPPSTCSRPGLRHAPDMLLHPRWLCGMASVLARSTAAPPSQAKRPDWRDLIWLRTAWRGKLVLKGVLRPDDAKVAAQLGADGIIVGNSSSQPGAAAAMDMLPHIAAAAGKQLAILVEGDLRSGMDVVKALSLGADMVLVDHATLYGAAAAGQAGAERALQILRAEIERVLTLIGCASVEALGPAFLAGRLRPASRRREQGAQETRDDLPPGVLRFRQKSASVLSMHPSPDGVRS